MGNTHMSDNNETRSKSALCTWTRVAVTMENDYLKLPKARLLEYKGLIIE